MRSAPERSASASVSCTTPVSLRSSVTRTPVSGSYRCRASTSPSGATLNSPPLASSSNAQQWWGVEAGNAHPSDAAVEAHQRRGRAVADQAEIGQRRVAAFAPNRAECGIRIKHRVRLLESNKHRDDVVELLVHRADLACHERLHRPPPSLAWISGTTRATRAQATPHRDLGASRHDADVALSQRGNAHVIAGTRA